MSQKYPLTGLFIMTLSAAAVGYATIEEAKAGEKADGIAKAVAVLHPTKGSEAHGTVTFERMGAGIAIGAEIEGLTPGRHGFHIHELGDCSAPDATSAGGHFNPEGSRHGAPEDQERHVGDLGNVTANDSGAAGYKRTDGRVAFEGPHSIIGRAVIVHAGEDDLHSQPTGAAGPRVACGVIGIARVTAGR